MGGTWLTSVSGRKKVNAIVIAVFAAMVASLPPIYYGWEILEKSAPLVKLPYDADENMKQPKLGEESLREPQSSLNIPQLTETPWVGQTWYEVNGPGELCLDPASIADGHVPVNIDCLPQGPLAIHLRTEGKRSYRGPVICRDHGAEVSDHDAVITRLGNNLLRVRITFNSPTLKDIDKIFYVRKE